MTKYGRVTVADRHLESRGYLLLTYPTKTKYGIDYDQQKVKIPFYENPSIQETQSSRYANYKLLGRNSNLLAFLGADSRALELRFNLTLPHLEHFITELPWLNKDYLSSKGKAFAIERSPTIGQEELGTVMTATGQFDFVDMSQAQVDANKLLAQNEAAAESLAGDTYKNQKGLKSIEAIEQHRQAFNTLRADAAGIDVSAFNQPADVGPVGRFFDKYLLNEPPPSQSGGDVKAAFYYFTNLIRTTTLGSRELGLGPPIVRLSFGPLYQDVPCAAMKYAIEIDELSGYDRDTLLPRRVKIHLSLQELRVGEYSYHTPNELLSDDNVPTWESVFDYGTVDPRIGPRINTGTSLNDKEAAFLADLEKRII